MKDGEHVRPDPRTYDCGESVDMHQIGAGLHRFGALHLAARRSRPEEPPGGAARRSRPEEPQALTLDVQELGSRSTAGDG